MACRSPAGAQSQEGLGHTDDGRWAWVHPGLGSLRARRERWSRKCLEKPALPGLPGRPGDGLAAGGQRGGQSLEARLRASGLPFGSLPIGPSMYRVGERPVRKPGGILHYHKPPRSERQVPRASDPSHQVTRVSPLLCSDSSPCSHRRPAQHVQTQPRGHTPDHSPRVKPQTEEMTTSQRSHQQADSQSRVHYPLTRADNVRSAWPAHTHVLEENKRGITS